MKSYTNLKQSKKLARKLYHITNGSLQTKQKKAVEIAREETTDKIKRLLKENYLVKSTEPLRWVSWEKVFNNIKQAMKDE